MQIKCPKCGNVDLSKMEWYEMVPSYRKILGMVVPVGQSKSNPYLALHVESEDFFEGSEGGRIVCGNCDTEFSAPEDLSVEFMDDGEYQEIRNRLQIIQKAAKTIEGQLENEGERIRIRKGDET